MTLVCGGEPVAEGVVGQDDSRCHEVEQPAGPAWEVLSVPLESRGDPFDEPLGKGQLGRIDDPHGRHGQPESRASLKVDQVSVLADVSGPPARVGGRFPYRSLFPKHLADNQPEEARPTPMPTRRMARTQPGPTP